MSNKPQVDLNKATIEIARPMLGTPPKAHDEMKLGKPTNPEHAKRKRKTKAKPAR